MGDADLHLIRAALDRRRLFELAHGRRLPPRDVDLGYLIHCALKGLFGDLAPQPFTWTESRGALTLLGYATSPAERLLEHARAFADPLFWSICPERTVVSKPMPVSFPLAHRLGFEVRVCPVLRKSTAGERHRAGAEVDVFLSRCWEAGDGVTVDREAVYRDWLTERFAGSGVHLLDAQMTAFQRERVVRSTHAAEPRVRRIERPDARFRGNVQIEDPAAFLDLLRRGLAAR